MTNEEKIRLVLETLGVDNVKQATKAIRDMEEAAEDLGDEIKSGLIKANGDLLLTLKDGQKITANSAEGFRKLLDQQGKFFVTLSDGQKRLMDADDATRAAADALSEYQERAFQASRSIRDMESATDSLEGEMDQLARSIREGVEKETERFILTLKDGRKVWNDSAEGIRHIRDAAEAATGKKGFGGRGLLELSYAIDDVQYGFRGIINNIPRIAEQFGLAAGAVGAVGIAAVGVNQALNLLNSNFPELMKWTDKVREKVGELNDAMVAQENSIKRQREEIEKLSESESSRYEDLVKLKNATEDLGNAEKNLSEERKNRKIADDAAKNAPIEQIDALGMRKDAVKGVVTDAGRQAELLQQITQSVEAGTPDAALTAADMRKAQADALKEMPSVPMLLKQGLSRQAISDMQKKAVEKKVGEARARAQANRLAEIRKTSEGVFGGLINPENMAQFDESMTALGQFAPGFAQEIQGVIGFDQQTAQEQAALEARSRAAARRRVRLGRADAAGAAAMREFNAAALKPDEALKRGLAAAGPAGGVANLIGDGGPDAGQVITPEQQAEFARQAAIRNQVMGIADPGQMAAARMYQAAQAGPNRNRVLRNLERRDMELYAGAMSNAGMTPADAQQAAQESLAGGNRAFQDFAAATGKSLNSNLRTLEAATMFMQQQNTNMDEIQMRLNMLTEQINAMGGQAQPTARPPARVRN